MNQEDARDLQEVLARIRGLSAAGELRVTENGQQEMAEEDVTLGEVLEAIAAGQILENYPDHRRGPCCLVYGRTVQGRRLHIVCTSGQPVVIVITVYEPRPPKWVTPTQRG